MAQAEQVQAYLVWARERGLRFPLRQSRVFAAASLATQAPPVALAPSPAPRRADAEAGSARRQPDSSPGYGSSPARVLFVGDGPDPAALAACAAYAGAERELLDKMIVAMRLGPADVYVTNALPLLPDASAQTPDAALCEAGRARLRRLVAAARPELVVVLGAWTLRLLLGERAHFPDLHGRLLPAAPELEAPVLVTYHPRDLLRFPANKRLAWADLQVAMAALGLKDA